MDTWRAEQCAPVHAESGAWVATHGTVSGSGTTEQAAREDLGRNLGVAYTFAKALGAGRR